MNFTAFYLPQFHPVPENDAIYGPGFTEWDNVRNAQPLFSGHYEPHIPHPSIGYYSLLDEQFLEDQHRLALAFGLNSFCYYYYNFAGHTVLEQPLIKINRSRKIKNNFCLCWVHTSWYDNRKAPNNPFILQEYSLENAAKLFADLTKYWHNPRYILIDGCPLLVIWAPERHPQITAYAEVWRYLAKRSGWPGIFLAGVEAYLTAPPELFGLDAMIEFAPSWRKEDHVSEPDEKPVRIDYQKTINFMLTKPKPSYTRVRCTFPGWVNASMLAA